MIEGFEVIDHGTAVCPTCGAEIPWLMSAEQRGIIATGDIIYRNQSSQLFAIPVRPELPHKVKLIARVDDHRLDILREPDAVTLTFRQCPHAEAH